MKKVLLFIALLALPLFSQTPVIVQQKNFGWNTVLDQQTITSTDTTKEFFISPFIGNNTVWFKVGTVDSIKSDVSVSIELYNKITGGWGEYITGPSMTSISSSKITANNEFYIKLTDYEQWAWADKARLIISVSSTSGFELTVLVGGQ